MQASESNESIHFGSITNFMGFRIPHITLAAHIKWLQKKVLVTSCMVHMRISKNNAFYRKSIRRNITNLFVKLQQIHKPKRRKSVRFKLTFYIFWGILIAKERK